MKSVLAIPLITVACFTVACVLLNECGVHVNLGAPIAAAIIASVAGIFGVLPIAIAKPKEPVGKLQLALVGTIAHLGGAIALAFVAIATHFAAANLDFVYWLLAGYWISLIVLIWQLRHRLIAATDIPKGPATI